MDATNSVSKGVFVFKNQTTCAKGRKKAQRCNSFLDANTTNQLWFRIYKKHWERSRQMILKMQTSSYGKIIDDLLKFIESCQQSDTYEGFLPTAALLTGINQTDHLSQFEKLAEDIRNNTLSIVVLLPSRDGTNLKQAIETIVGKCIHGQCNDTPEEKRFRKNQLNLDVLEGWYTETHINCRAKPKLTIIIPDFELFNPLILQDLILILDAIIDDEDDLKAIINELSSSELEQIRQLPSFRPHVESLHNPQEVVDILTNDDYLKRSLTPMIMKVHNYWFTFHCALQILHTAVSDLPKAPLGRQLRELYCHCVSCDVTELSEFKECMQLLSFLSKEEMLQKIKQVLDVVLQWVDRNDQLNIEGCLVYEVAPLEDMANGLVLLSENLAAASHEQLVDDTQPDKQYLLATQMGRQELREKLLTAAKHAK
uniref:Uncharacterized protein n=1 Tax=Anopheles christyi TaxID=43041 RepID=A0A182JWP1_9DIPT